MRVFTDTNVLVSAFTSRGLCADLFEIILADHELVIGEVVLTELERVLTLKLHIPQDKVNQTLSFLRKHDIEPLPDRPSDVEIKDEDDRWVLESALRAKADILVTGDRDLLDISTQVSQVKIISPRGFWDFYKK